MKNTYVFLAGGIGITPFRSIIQDLIDRHVKADIVLFYQAKDADELLFQDTFAEGQDKIGLQVHYVVNNHITEDILREHVPDFLSRVYMISGPISFVDHYREMVHQMGVPFEAI
jgi:ferredoxin-NADP reductase